LLFFPEMALRRCQEDWAEIILHFIQQVVSLLRGIGKTYKMQKSRHQFNKDFTLEKKVAF